VVRCDWQEEVRRRSCYLWTTLGVLYRSP